MFTGIVSQLGRVKKITKQIGGKRFIIAPTKKLKLKKGDSIAINGACMTICEIEQNTFSFDAIDESLNKTNLNLLNIDDQVNLEMPLKINQGFHGHIVQGHVDTMATVKEINENLFTIETPKKLSKYIAQKGSVTLNGVSLTVSKLTNEDFSVSIIPYTLKNTNFFQLKKGDEINLEIDILARYLEQLTKRK